MLDCPINHGCRPLLLLLLLLLRIFLSRATADKACRRLLSADWASRYHQVEFRSVRRMAVCLPMQQWYKGGLLKIAQQQPIRNRRLEHKLIPAQSY